MDLIESVSGGGGGGGLPTLVVDLIEMCMWVLNRARDNSDRITALQTYSFEAGFFFFFFFFFAL